MATFVKILLALLFFLCVLRLPYGYYQGVRLLALVGFGYLSYNSFENGRKNIAVVYALLAILFQPIFKIALGREFWNVLDIVIGLGLLVSLFVKVNKA